MNQRNDFNLPSLRNHDSAKELHYDRNGSYVILTEKFLSTFPDGNLLINVYNSDTKVVDTMMMIETYGI